MSGSADTPSPEDLAEALRQIEIGPFLVSTVATLASLVHGKIEQGELAQAKAGIDAIAALVPVVSGEIDAGVARDLERNLTILRLAYADAVTAAL